MSDLPQLIDALGSIATRQQLLAAGFSGSDLTREVRSGRIVRVRQARYSTPNADRDRVAAARIGGMLAGPSAAASYGLWSGTDPRLHVSVGRTASRLRTSVRGRDLTPDTSARKTILHWVDGGAVPELGPECWRVSLAACLRQMVAWCDRQTAVACLDTALTVAGLSRSDVGTIFAGAVASDRITASRCRTGSDSGTESLVRQHLAALNIQCRQQVQIPGVGRVDFGLVGTRIVIEVDSWRHHGDRGAFERDRRRDAELAARGYTVIRLTYDRVITDWPWCARMILAAIAAES